MAKMLVCALVAAALLANVALGQACNASVSTASNPFRRSTCSGHAMCEMHLCGCVGSTSSLTNVSCLAATPASTNCSQFTHCMRGYVGCLAEVALTAKMNATNDCRLWAESAYSQMLVSAVTAYNGSTVQQACAERVCQLRNMSGKDACDMGANFSLVCNPMHAVTTLPPAMTTQPANGNGTETPAPSPSTPGTPGGLSPSSASAVSTLAVAVLALVAALA